MDFENKVADSKYTNRLLGFVLKKAKKGCLEVIFISELEQKESLDGSGLQLEQRTGKELDCRLSLIEGSTLVENDGCVTGSGSLEVESSCALWV